MRISHGRAGGPSEQRGPTFTGRVWADPVLEAQDQVGVNNVFFEPGARTHWHRHEVGQVLHVTSGAGWLQTRAGDGTPLSGGDTAHIPAGEEHWHGAAPDACMSHLAISVGANEWLDPVSDEDYASAFRGR
jgi:quercetin dioxygenase-like cupin family protein